MNINKKYTVGLACLLVSATAYAFPWDIDLVDSPALKGYKWRMMKPADNSISQEQSSPFTGLNAQYTKGYDKTGVLIITPEDDKDAPTMTRIKSPDHETKMQENASIYANSKEAAIRHYASIKYNASSDTRDPMIKAGEKMAKTYCQACHVVVSGEAPPPVTWSKSIMDKRGDNVNRWSASKKIELAGPKSRITQNPYTNNDNAVYDVIRNGWNSMPAYGHAMDEHEIWATIAYLRSVSK